MPISLNELTLGDFVKHLSALLQRSGTDLPFKNERAWHLAFYELKEAAGPPRPKFLDSLVFDWDGEYPKSQKLSEFLHALHWNASVSAGNPSYEAISLNEEVQALWSQPVEQLEQDDKDFFDQAIEVAKREFAAAS